MKQLSRQRLWQIEHVKRGLCCECHGPVLASDRCGYHWLKMTSYQRDRYRDISLGRKYSCLSEMIEDDVLSGDGFCDETKKRIKQKFGRTVDIKEFLGDI